MGGLASRGRVIHGYPATRSQDDALALLRREVDAGAMPRGRTAEALAEANARALDALAGIPDAAALSMLGYVMVERGADPGPERRNLSEAEFNEEGAAFAPFVTDEQRAAFLAALTREAEKRVLVMPSGADLDRYASEAAPSGVGAERVGSRERAEEKGEA